MTKVTESTLNRVVAGLLLTGGASRRMGTDKSRLLVEGRHVTGHLAEMLVTVTNPVREVGPGVTGLMHLVEERPGEGPLSAMVSGWAALCQIGTPDAVVVIACDLPMLSVNLLRLLVNWPGDTSVVPVV
ncbi:MAG: NTP transferase domain-containing protein, partial [Acidimicrobiales bacterium]